MPGALVASTGTEMAQLASGQWINLSSAQAMNAEIVQTTTALFNLPAFLITAVITILLVIGIRESAVVNATLVVSDWASSHCS